MKQIKYFAVNEEIENQIKSIRRTIYLSMNGICAENIDNSGLEYKQNFGVSWSRLCEIAQNYTPNYTLAERLWLMSIRETKLLATLLCPPLELTQPCRNIRHCPWPQLYTPHPTTPTTRTKRKSPPPPYRLPHPRTTNKQHRHGYTTNHNRTHKSSRSRRNLCLPCHRKSINQHNFPHYRTQPHYI